MALKTHFFDETEQLARNYPKNGKLKVLRFSFRDENHNEKILLSLNVVTNVGLLMELLNFQVEIPTLKCSNSTMKVGFSSPLQGKTSESHNSPTT